MSNDKIFTIIKEKNKKEIIHMLETNGKIKTLSFFAEVLNKRTYFTLSSDGIIKRNELNFILPIFAFSNDFDYLADSIINFSDLKEREKISNISRLSNIKIPKLKEKLIKTLCNGNLDFSKKYGKELFLRDREEFYKIILEFSFLGDMKSLKALLILSFKKLFENKEYEENVFFLLICFITKYRDNFYFYENCQHSNIISLEKLKENILSNKELSESREGLEIFSTLKALEMYNFKNFDKFLSKIVDEIRMMKNLTALDETTKKLTAAFL
ncbi:hypothetical protein [Fusobacterium sp.]|uniref:hypothetical protein n=1 Tax=Fusobacterium sp. TaxID=68766 RepID=UPI002904BC33|nr:hypothetical protein [Fusobacterium sp.]MDU1909808.1 hypothetical protein [Fusobacterium sp.]